MNDTVGLKMTFLPKFPKAVVACVVVVCGGAVLWLWSRESGDIRYFERVSGISFPHGISEIQVTRPREFCFSGRMTIPKAGEETFLKSFAFRPSRDFPLNANLGLDRSRFSKPDHLNDWFGVFDRSSKNRWEIAYCQGDRTLWFVMLCEDAHGDPPP